jgi:hypothetical protein
MLAFPLSVTSSFPWNETFTNWLAMIMFYSKLEFYISDVKLSNLIIYYVSITIVMLNLINAVVVAYRFYKKLVQNTFLLKTLRYMTSSFASVLYIPFLS